MSATTTPVQLVYNLPLRVDQRPLPAARTRSGLPPTVAAYLRSDRTPLFLVAANRAEAAAKQAPQLTPQPLNVPLTLATAAALATLVPVALRQFKLIRNLPDPDHHRFNSNRVVTSHKSKILGVPDSALGLGSYSATLVLVLLAPKNPVARKLVGPKLAVDTGIATVNTVRQFTSFNKLCSWCFLTAAATAAMAITGRKSLRSLV